MTKVEVQTKKLQVRDTVCGVFNLGVVVAESSAAYVLYFSSKSISLRAVAALLIADAAIRATKQFVVLK